MESVVLWALRYTLKFGLGSLQLRHSPIWNHVQTVSIYDPITWSEPVLNHQYPILRES